jgi:penicillin-binding protein 1C
VASNAKLPLPLRRFLGELLRPAGEQAPHIRLPLNGSRIDVAGSGGAQFSAMPVEVADGVLPMTMLVNGVSMGEIDGRRQRLIDPPGPGFARLTVIDRRHGRRGHNCHQNSIESSLTGCRHSGFGVIGTDG